MDMSGHNHGEMMGTSYFLADNKQIANTFWYIIAAVALGRGLRSLIDYLRNVFAKRRHSLRAAVPSRPRNTIEQTYETFITILREISYPALRPYHGRIFRSFTPPPLGQSLFILSYWFILLIMLWTNVLLGPSSPMYGYHWEKPAFRAGWVSVAQLPLMYALSCKFNVISIVTGISYERLNWLHRWVARTMFLTVIMHWAYFFHEWTLADFVKYQLELMPMVKYGFGAWALLGWMVITGFGFFRDLCYELWVLQHVAGAGVLLWLVWVHVPSYARYNVWMAIGFVAFDRGARVVWGLINNLHLKSFGKGGIGFRSEAVALDNGYIRLSIKDVDFSWRAGQHVFLSIPACGIFESHPFTIASRGLGLKQGSENVSSDFDVFLKCHNGFTGRLLRRARRATEQQKPFAAHRVILSGPWGSPPLAAVERSSTLVFIASSTGAAYTMPILEHAVRKAPFVQRIYFNWIVRYNSQINWFADRLRITAQELQSLRLEEVTFKVFVTGIQPSSEPKNLTVVSGVPLKDLTITSQPSLSAGDSADVKSATILEKTPLDRDTSRGSSSSSTDGLIISPAHSSLFTASLGRPDSLDPLIRPAVEAALGETVIIACGGKDMMAQIRTYVAGLSDERAVHKGTGAQGIYLWTETYGW